MERGTLFHRQLQMRRRLGAWCRSLPLLLLSALILTAVPEAQARQDLWLTKAHDARRTGQSQSNGPMAIDPAQSWTAEAPGAHTLNIGATVTEHGVFFGSWGLLRRVPGNPDPRLWDRATANSTASIRPRVPRSGAARSTSTSCRAVTISTGAGRTCSGAASRPTRSLSTTAPSKGRPPPIRAAMCSTWAGATASSSPSTPTPGASSGATSPSTPNCPTTRTVAARWFPLRSSAPTAPSTSAPGARAIMKPTPFTPSTQTARFSGAILPRRRWIIAFSPRPPSAPTPRPSTSVRSAPTTRRCRRRSMPSTANRPARPRMPTGSSGRCRWNIAAFRSSPPRWPSAATARSTSAGW